MPVKLEHIHQPADADWTDLNKIQQETAPHGLSQSQSDLEHWLSDNHWVMAGRFNDRIIGALLATKNNDGEVILSEAGVRAVTQRRGVMHQMIHFIQRWANEENARLVVNNCPEELSQALVRRGFEPDSGHLIYNPS